MAGYDYYYNKNKAYADEQYAKTSAANTAAAEKLIADTKAAYDPAIASAKANADTQTQGLNQQFQKDYDTQAIQEAVNKRKLAESMANQGLSNSGLNSTQQTALAVTRTNNEGAITQQKNTQARQIAQSLDNYLNGVNSTLAQNSAATYANLSATNQNVYNSIYNALSDNATSLANADTAAEAARYKAQQEAAAAEYKAQLAAQAAAEKQAKANYNSYYTRAKDIISNTYDSSGAVADPESGRKTAYDYIAHTLVDSGELTYTQGKQLMTQLGISPDKYINTRTDANQNMRYAADSYASHH